MCPEANLFCLVVIVVVVGQAYKLSLSLMQILRSAIG